MPIYRLPVRLTWSGNGSPGANIWHIRTTTSNPVGDVELAGAVTKIHDFYAGVIGMLAAGTKVEADYATVTDTKEMAPVTWAPMTSGAATGDLPPAVQVVVSWRTSIAARRGMGRTFIGPLSGGMCDAEGTVSDSQLDSLRNTATALVNASTAATGWSIGVYGLQDQAPPGISSRDRAALPHVLRDITSVRVKDQFAVLRSRRD